MIQLLDRDGRGQNRRSGRVKGEEDRTAANAIIITSCCFLLPRKENTPPRICLSGTHSFSICFSSVKLWRYELHYFLCVLYLALTCPLTATLLLYFHFSSLWNLFHTSSFFFFVFPIYHSIAPSFAPAPSFPL